MQLNNFDSQRSGPSFVIDAVFSNQLGNQRACYYDVLSDVKLTLLTRNLKKPGLVRCYIWATVTHMSLKHGQSLLLLQRGLNHLNYGSISGLWKSPGFNNKKILRRLKKELQHYPWSKSGRSRYIVRTWNIKNNLM